MFKHRLVQTNRSVETGFVQAKFMELLSDPAWELWISLRWGNENPTRFHICRKSAQKHIYFNDGCTWKHSAVIYCFSEFYNIFLLRYFSIQKKSILIHESTHDVAYHRPCDSSENGLIVKGASSTLQLFYFLKWKSQKAKKFFFFLHPLMYYIL